MKKQITREEAYAHLVGSMELKQSDERDSGKITGILRGNNTSTGQHSIPESPFAACEIVTPRYKTERPTSSGEHSHWASPLAAVEEQSNNPPIKLTTIERMQELKVNDDQLGETITTLEERETKMDKLFAAGNEQMAIKNKQMDKLIA